MGGQPLWFVPFWLLFIALSECICMHMRHDNSRVCSVIGGGGSNRSSPLPIATDAAVWQLVTCHHERPPFRAQLPAGVPTSRRLLKTCLLRFKLTFFALVIAYFLAPHFLCFRLASAQIAWWMILGQLIDVRILQKLTKISGPAGTKQTRGHSAP